MSVLIFLILIVLNNTHPGWIIMDGEARFGFYLLFGIAMANDVYGLVNKVKESS